MNNNWLDEEMQSIERDIKKKRSCRKFNHNSEYLRVFLLLLAVFFYTLPINANSHVIFHDDHDYYIIDASTVCLRGGIWFMCTNCRTCQWQDDNQKDWRGDFYCVACGKKYGE